MNFKSIWAGRGISERSELSEYSEFSEYSELSEYSEYSEYSELSVQSESPLLPLLAFSVIADVVHGVVVHQARAVNIAGYATDAA